MPKPLAIWVYHVQRSLSFFKTANNDARWLPLLRARNGGLCNLCGYYSGKTIGRVSTDKFVVIGATLKMLI